MLSIDEKYLSSLAKDYPTIQAICKEIINLKAILNLPKGTEHYISDLHGEYKLFKHLMNNCSGVIKEKVNLLFSQEITSQQINELCYLVYYPRKLLAAKNFDQQWYKESILRLIRLARYITSKYTRSKVRHNINNEYSEIIDELLHAQLDEMDQQYVYHLHIIDSIIELGEQDYFIESLTKIIKHFAVDQLHILGDIFDRGKEPDKIIDDLIKYKRVDIQWGNHDILWMGAYLGNLACIMTVVKNCLKYRNIDLLEKSYGIPLRILMMHASQCYPDINYLEAMEKLVMKILNKLETRLINNYPQWQMTYRVSHPDTQPLDKMELFIIDDLKKSFASSKRLKKHIKFIYEHGSLYLKTNHNLLLHGCVSLDEKGDFYIHDCFGQKLAGRKYFDEVDHKIHQAFNDPQPEIIDYFWYLWCGKKSPLCGRKIVLDDPQEEVKDPYYHYINDEKICLKILSEFNLHDPVSMIINGHTPVKVKDGENPLKGNNHCVVIDGGFCLQYQGKTGVAGYTLISNSHGMRLKTHLINQEYSFNINNDMEYDSQIIYTRQIQELIKDTKKGLEISERIEDLNKLLKIYRCKN